MGKVVDITEKLTFDESPSLKIKGEALEVNSDAPTMLKVMGLMGADDPGVKEIVGAYEMLFPEASREKLDSMKLSFMDLVTVIQEAITLVTGEGTGQGEQ